jgi:hypothetical protein
MGIRRWSISAAIIVVLTASLLTLVHFETPPAHAKAAVSTGSYGSGTLGSWQGDNRVISSSTEVRHVVASDGVLLFGDSSLSRTARRSGGSWVRRSRNTVGPANRRRPRSTNWPLGPGRTDCRGGS